MQTTILVVAEILNNNLRPVTFELIAFAEELAKKKSASVNVITINPAPGSHAEEISTATGHDVIAVTTPCMEDYNGDVYKNILRNIVGDLAPSFICIAHTSQGIDFAPGLAVKLGYSCITSINGISGMERETVFSRFIFGGKMNAFIKSETPEALLTIQPGVFNKIFKPDKTGAITRLTMDDCPLRVRSAGIEKQASAPSHLGDANTIISIGRGIENPESISLAEKFASYFTDAAIACSRPVVDMGWMKYKHQVGITGAEVAPEIYIACGISGSSQHIAGMNRSKFIVAINSDPNAAIFNVSDICITADLSGFFKSFDEIQD